MQTPGRHTVALFAMAFLGPPAARAAPPAVPLDAVVSVQLGESTCAGAFVAEDRVITAYHCVASGGRAVVTTRDGLSATARVVGTSVADDLALLETPVMAPEVLEVRVDAPEIAESVWAIGQPFGGVGYGYMEGTLGWSVSSGIVSTVGRRAVQTTAPVAPGYSGGPLVDEDGRIVGVVSRRLRGDGLGFATRGDAVAQLLSDERGPRLLGGTVSLSVGSTFLSAVDGEVAVDGLLQLAVRDRLVLSGTLAAPVTNRWRLMQVGSSRWVRASARGGLRQRVGRGESTMRLDVHGGVASVAVVEPFGDYGTIGGTSVAPLVGGGLSVYSIGIHTLAVHLEEGWALQVGTYLSLPGVFARF